jgi:sodium-dependent dicarboxylate transporter 2/3/5
LWTPEESFLFSTGVLIMAEVEEATFHHGRRHYIGLLLGPALFIIILIFFDLEPSNPIVTRTAAVAVLMAVWWLTEAIPIAATALIPMALFPALGIMSGRAVAPIYFNYIIFLFIGGFIIALAMQKWNLHRRIAIRIIILIGASPRKVILGFMCATAFLSMWISNTATTMMMVPIAAAVLDKIEDTFGKDVLGRFPVALLIGIAYAASIGGIATLIGTPPNLVLIRILKISFPDAPEISFASWMAFGLPFSIVFLLIAWRLLLLIFVPRKSVFRSEASIFREEYKKLGKIKYEEVVVLITFLALALLWIFSNDIVIGNFVIPGWTRIMPESGYIDDGSVAIFMALLLFLIPSRTKEKGRLMDWKTARRLPWGIVILFGGGFALAAGFKESGLSDWLGGQLGGFSYFPALIIILMVCSGMTFLTEMTSNTATTQMILPILASIAVAIKMNPLMLMIPATLSASCAFMLPVATPPNAIIFGTGRITIGNLARAGFLLNLIGIFLVTLAVYLLGRIIFGINPAEFPSWAAIS